LERGIREIKRERESGIEGKMCERIRKQKQNQRQNLNQSKKERQSKILRQ
jgi:hypothetical protein